MTGTCDAFILYQSIEFLSTRRKISLGHVEDMKMFRYLIVAGQLNGHPSIYNACMHFFINLKTYDNDPSTSCHYVLHMPSR